ncbi:DUF1254 domain-containing protein [Roseovarius sp. S4756]|uniref:DUF1254 domain-containing protein n=1 Tax=Roseovarius maritimus TaxID=3342637 RepID=UPI003727B353
MKITTLSLAAAVAAAALLAPVAHAQDVTPEEAREIAKEAYTYGYPLVDNYRVNYSFFVDESSPEFKAPWNELANINRVFTPADTAVQSPNSDTPYSWAGLDLRAEPIVISLPKIEADRYYSVQIWDAYTYVIGYAGSRTTGNDATNIMVVGPSWTGETPDGIDHVYTSDTEFGMAAMRTQLFNPDDIGNVEAIQAQYQIQPLSAFLGTPPPPPAPDMDFIEPLSAEDQKTSLEFFNIMNFVLSYSPPVQSEAALRERFAKIGIEGGKTFDPSTLSPEMTAAIEAGRDDALADFADVVQKMNVGKITSGDIFGSRDFLGDNYLYRWLGTVGIYGNAKEEAMYPVLAVDSTGQTLNGANRYTLHFPADELPPVNAFWSLTMYELPASLLVANPLDRYLLNSTMMDQFVRDDDGGLTLYFQNESPGKEKEANWLPASEGPFWVVLRLYWPKEAALNGSWTAPSIERVTD